MVSLIGETKQVDVLLWIMTRIPRCMQNMDWLSPKIYVDGLRRSLLSHSCFTPDFLFPLRDTCTLHRTHRPDLSHCGESPHVKKYACRKNYASTTDPHSVCLWLMKKFLALLHLIWFNEALHWWYCVGSGGAYNYHFQFLKTIDRFKLSWWFISLRIK